MACHARSYTDPARSHDGEAGRGPRMDLRGTHDVGEGNLPVVLACHGEERTGNESRSSRDEEGSDLGNHDDVGCSHEAEHDDHIRPRPEDIHGEEGSENGQSVHAEALLESIYLW